MDSASSTLPRNVLIVDDEPTIADTLGVILRKSGFATYVAYNAADALRYTEQFVPALLISDVMMPGMNGIQLAIEIKRRFAGCKVLLFSGVANSVTLLQDAREMGYDFEFLSKPVHPSELLRLIA